MHRIIGHILLDQGDKTSSDKILIGNMLHRLKDQRMMTQKHIRTDLFRPLHRRIVRVQCQQDLLYILIHTPSKKSRIVPVTGTGLRRKRL